MMMPPSTFQDEFMGCVTEMIQKSVVQGWEEAKKKMIQEIDMNRDRDIAAIVLHISKQISMNDMGTHLTIHISKKDV